MSLHLAGFRQKLTHHIARAGPSYVGIEGALVFPKDPGTFRKLHAILVQVQKLVVVKARPHPTLGREGDSVVARGEAGEDAGVEVELAASSSWAIRIVEV